MSLPHAISRPAFRRFWGAQSLAYLGDMVSWIALPLVAVDILHASVAEVGILTAIAPLPTLMLGAHIGALVDRRQGEFAIMRTAAVVRALVLASVPLAAVQGVLTFAHLVAAAAVVGVASVFFNVAASTALPTMCRRDELIGANSATRFSFSAAAVAGPSVGGILTQLTTAADALLFDSLAFVLAALLLVRLRPDHPRSHVPDAQDDGRVIAALRAVRRDRAQLGILVQTIAGSFGFTSYFTVLIVFATRDLHLDAGQLGTALGIGAAGAIAGSLLAAPLARALGLGRTLLVGAITYPAVLIAVAFAPTNSPVQAMVLIAAAEFVSAAALMLADIPASSIQQAITPPRLLGRVRGVTLAANYGARTAAGLCAGVTAQHIGNHATLVTALTLATAATALAAATPLRTMRDLKHDEGEPHRGSPLTPPRAGTARSAAP